MLMRPISQMLAAALPCFLSLTNTVVSASNIGSNLQPQNNVLSNLQRSISSKISNEESKRNQIETSLLKFYGRMINKKDDHASCLQLIGKALSSFEKEKDTEGVELCRQLIEQLANPSQVNQGNHNTCALAALESRLIREVPSIVCRIVFEARTGIVNSSDGRKVFLPEVCRKPDREARVYQAGKETRSYPSQLFQIAAANIYWQTQKKDARGINVPEGSIAFVQDETRGATFDGDTHERLVIQWTGNREFVSNMNGLPENSPSFSMDCLMKTYEMLTNKSAKHFLLAHRSTENNKPATLFRNKADLASRLRGLKRSGELPAIVAIHPDGELIQTSPRLLLHSPSQSVQLLRPKSSWHVVCINDIDESTGQVELDNFWGPTSDYLDDKKLPLDQLYASSFSTEALERTAPQVSALTVTR